MLVFHGVVIPFPRPIHWNGIIHSYGANIDSADPIPDVCEATRWRVSGTAEVPHPAARFGAAKSEKGGGQSNLMGS